MNISPLTDEIGVKCNVDLIMYECTSKGFSVGAVSSQGCTNSTIAKIGRGPEGVDFRVTDIFVILYLCRGSRPSLGFQQCVCVRKGEGGRRPVQRFSNR